MYNSKYHIYVFFYKHTKIIVMKITCIDIAYVLMNISHEWIELSSSYKMIICPKQHFGYFFGLVE